MTVEKASGVLYENEELEPVVHEETDKKHQFKYSWKNVLIHGYLHLGGIYGLYLALTDAKWQTFVMVFCMHVMKNWGVAAGAHRLWSHRAYKANLPLRVLLMFFFILTFEGPLFGWVRYHRVHHKYQETDADPHDARRGFWFAHYGWLLQKRHPEVLTKGKGMEMADIKKEKLVMFQKKYYWQLVLIFCCFLPTFIPVHFWGEKLNTAWHFGVCLQYVISLHVTFCINSFAHIWGKRPYDKSIYARENIGVSIVTMGEGWHNYHHIFPWDYKTSELGNYGVNWSAMFIDFMAMIGWAYDLKTVPTHLVKKRADKTGDGSYELPEVFGWNDKDLPDEDRKEAIIINRKED